MESIPDIKSTVLYIQINQCSRTKTDPGISDKDFACTVKSKEVQLTQTTSEAFSMG